MGGLGLRPRRRIRLAELLRLWERGLRRSPEAPSTNLLSIHGVQTVFMVAAPIAALALAVVLALRETPLRTTAPGGSGPAPKPTALPAAGGARPTAVGAR